MTAPWELSSFKMLDLFNIAPPWPVGMLLYGLLLILTYLAALDLIAESDRRPTLAEAAVSSIVGLTFLGFLLLIVRWASLPSSAMSFLLVALAAQAAWRRRNVLVPRLESQFGLGLVTVVAVTLAFVLPCLIGGTMMAVGDYPQVFFHADTPNRLQHAYEFIQDRGMPPLSLSNFGVESQTHFAAPAAAAAAALFTGIAAHSAFFLTLTAAAFGIVAAVSLLAASLRPGPPFALAFALILGAAPLTVWDAGKVVKEGFSNPELFFNQFPDITILFGLFLFLVLLYACLNLTDLRRAFLATLATVLLAAAKTGYFPIAGLLLLSATLLRAWQCRDWRWLLLPVGTFIVGFAVTQITGSSVRVHLTFEPLFFFSVFGDRALKHGLDLVLFLLPVAAYALVARRPGAASKEEVNRLLILGLTFAGLLVFLNLIGNYTVHHDGTREPNSNILQPLKMMPKLLALAAVLALSLYWNPGRRHLNMAIVFCLSLIFMLPLAHRAIHALRLLVDPQSGHEYVDNRPIAEALVRIPIAGTVIVTNDLRYPANGFKRDRRQMQIPAIFGHQAYAVDTISYESYADEMLTRVYPDAKLRVAQQKRLAGDVWDPDFSRIAKEQHWTHLLIHKGASHPPEIPLPKLFENDRYAVYVFE